MPQKSNQKTQKRRLPHQNARQRFLATSASIGHNYACDFDGVHPQGVQWDSLEGFRTVGEWQVVDTPTLCAVFARAASAIILYVL